MLMGMFASRYISRGEESEQKFAFLRRCNCPPMRAHDAVVNAPALSREKKCSDVHSEEKEEKGKDKERVLCECVRVRVFVCRNNGEENETLKEVACVCVLM